MNWPTSQDYNEAVQDPAGSFGDPALKGGQVAVNALGLPVPRSGNFADVYQFTGADGKVWALKCFTRQVTRLKERYARIDQHLARARLPFTVRFQFLQEGVRVRGQWYPLLKMEWVEGFTLNDFVARNLDKPQYLHALVQMWAKLAGRLRDADMAHADLQHGNVLLVPGATPQKLGLKLIDYDGMWVPALAEQPSGEVGHPNYQHPLRLRDKLYTGDVDRFPHLVIAAGLRAALVGGKRVWDKFDNEDNLLFKEADLRAPGKAPVFKALWELNDPVLRTLVGHIVLSAREPLRKTPWLDDVLFAEDGPRLSADQERQVCEALGVSAAVPVRAAGAPPAVEQEFNVFDFSGDDESDSLPQVSGTIHRPRYRRKKRSNAPLLVGGGALAACLAIGGVIAVAMFKKGTPPAVPDKNPPEYVGLVARPVPPDLPPLSVPPTVVPPDPKNDTPPIPPPAAPSPVTAVAALPADRDFLFIRQNDPVLYQTVNGDAGAARELGRAGSPFRTVAVAPDGSKAITGGADGEVRIWSRPADTGPPPTVGVIPRADWKDRIGNFPNIAEKWSFEAYPEGIVLRVQGTDQAATIAAGKPGYPVKEGFRANLTGNKKLADQLGEAVTDEIQVFDGSVTIQLFEGGVQFYDPVRKKSYWAYHAKRKPAVKTGPWTPTILKEHTKPVVAGAVSPDGTRVVTVGEDGHLCEWDLAAARLIRKFEVQTPTAVAFLPDGKSVIVGTESESASLWDLEKQTRVKELPGHRSAVRGICVAPTGERAWTGGEDGEVRMWKLPGGELTSTIPSRQGITAMALSPDGEVLACAGPNGAVRFYDAPTGRQRGTTPRATDPARAVAFVNGGQEIAYARGANLFKLPATRGGRPAETGRIPDPKPPTPEPMPTPMPTAGKTGFLKDSADLSGRVVAAGVSADGKRVFAVTNSGVVHVVDAATGESTRKFEATKAPVFDLVVSPKGLHPTSGVTIPERLYVLDGDRVLHTWETDKFSKLRTVHLEKGGLPDVSDKARLVIGPGESYVMVFDPDKPRGYSWVPGRWTVGAIPPPLRRPPFDKDTRQVAFSPDGSTGAAFAGGNLIVWRARTNKEARVIDPMMAPRWIGVAADAGAVGAADGGRLVAWKFETGAELMSVRDPHGFFGTYHCVTTPRGLVSAGSDRKLRLWDLQTGREADQWPLEQPPRGVAVSPDGRTAVVWYDDGNTVGLFALPELKAAKP